MSDLNDLKSDVFGFHRNNSCIEMLLKKIKKEDLGAFHRNNSCIEIVTSVDKDNKQIDSTETIVVLKFFYIFVFHNSSNYSTETIVVLKLFKLCEGHI